MLNEALELHAWGYSIFPLRPRDKRPFSDLLPKDAEGEPTWKPFTIERATIDQVRAWWMQEPEANIAIVCGEISGMFGLDVDGKDGIAELQKRGKMPVTPLVKTGKPDGWHIHFAHPAFAVPNKVGFLPGLDTRGESGYLVAPPSIHPNGTPYRWKLRPDERDKVQAPDWLLALLRPEPKPVLHRNRLPDYPHNASEDEALAIRALDALAPFRLENYKEWFRVGASLKPLGSAGLTLWDNWSARSAKYHPGDCARRWNGIEGTSLGALFNMANEDSGHSWRPVRTTTLETHLADRVKSIIAEPWTSVPMTARAALNAYAPAAVAPVLELWVEGEAAGLIHRGDPVSVKCLEYVSKELKRGVTRRVIETALNQGVVQFCTGLPDYVLSIGVDPKDSQPPAKPEARADAEPDCGCDPCDPLKAGRKAKLYQRLPQDSILENVAQLAVVPILEKHFPANGELVAPIRAEFLADLGRADADELADELETKYHDAIERQTGYQKAIRKARHEYRALLNGLEHPRFLPLRPGHSYGKVGEYVTECAVALLALNDGVMQLPKKDLCAQIGCSERNLLAVLRRAKAWVIKDQTIDGEPLTLAALETIVREQRYDKRFGGYPQAVRSARKDGVYGIDRAGVLVWAEAEIRSGASVFVRYSQANMQFIPCYALRRLWALAFLKALTQEVEPVVQVVKQQTLFPEPVAEPETVAEPVPVKPAKPTKVKPDMPPHSERPTYPEQWFERLVQVGVNQAHLAEPYAVNLAQAGDAKPELVQQSLDLLLYGVIPPQPGLIEPSTDAPNLAAADSKISRGQFEAQNPVSAPGNVSPLPDASPFSASEALKQTWKQMVSQFERFASGTLLLLPPSTTATPARASSSWHLPLPASP